MRKIFLISSLFLFFLAGGFPINIAFAQSPTPDPGTCKIIGGPPAIFENKCNAGFNMYQEGVLLDQCVCKPSGSPGNSVPTILAVTPVPSATPIAPPFPCANNVGGECKAVSTAIGNIETDPAAFIKKIFTVLLSMAGGWATYLIVVAGYKLMFSHGEAEGVKEAREDITSAIVGIVFMLLSLVILRVIGVDIFKLPTFN